MTVSPAEKDRRVLPRWRNSQVTASLGELGSLGGGRPAPLDSRGETELARRISDWEASGRSLAFAADVVSSALVLGRGAVAREAARQLLASSQPGSLAHSLAVDVFANKDRLPTEDIVGSEEESWKDVAKDGVREGRARVRRDPRNSLAWNDLARGYTILGQPTKATRAVRAGLALAPRNRLLLRSACRLLVQLEEHDQAHDVVRKSDLSRVDPWIMAAEIASAAKAGRHPESVSRGRKLLLNDDVSPFHMSELASAVATLEFENGNGRRSRKLLRQSLLQPTDNAVAQAEWLTERTGQRDDAVKLDVPFSFEARALRHADERRWDEALVDAHRWFHDEPFSSHSATFGSWVAAVGLEDYGEAARIARAGLDVNPHDLTLRNNLVFSLASQNLVDEAQSELFLVDLSKADEEDRVLLLATQGLIAYRRGDLRAGRQLYAQAIHLAKGSSGARMKAMALLNMAREEVRQNSAESNKLLSEALATARPLRYPEVREVAARLEDEVRGK
jgi:tetratricopeptide (TPR) repeat protein